MKKLLALMLCLVMSLSFAACGSNDKTETTTKKAITTTESTTTAAPEVKEYKDDIQVPNFTLKINDKNYTQADFSGLTLYSCEATSVNSAGTKTTIPYIGYKATDVLAKAGVTSFTKAICTASDQYEKEFDSKVFNLDTTLIAISKDDELLTDGVNVAPCSAKTSDQYVKKVATIVTQ